MFYKFIIIFVFLFCISTIANASYYVDAVNGSDNNDGSMGSPWATLEKARDTITLPSTVYVYSGQYNAYAEIGKNDRDGYLSFVAVQGNIPVIGGLSIDKSSYIEFVGFDIYSSSRTNLITISSVNNFKIKNCKINSDRWSRNKSNLVTAVSVNESSNIEVSNSNFFEIGRGVQILNSNNVTLSGNFITVKGGSGIQYLTGNTNTIIDGNHIRGELYTPYPEDPFAFDSPHQSGISLRTGNLTIKNNVIHGLGNTSGIMTYEPGAIGDTLSYDNITIENNSIYNTINSYAVRFYNAGENIVLRNNLVFSKIRIGECSGRTADARYMYSTALAVHSIAETSNGSGISLFNNIFVGAVFAPTTINEDKNIFWSLYSDGWKSTSPKGSSKVIVSSYLGCGNAPTLFEDGNFFKERVDMFFPEIINFNFLLSENSIAKNYGNPSLQSKKALGKIESNGFIVANGPSRNEELHSAGPFESYFVLTPPKDFFTVNQ